MRMLVMLSLAVLVAACQPTARGGSQAGCGPGGMGCAQGAMPYGDIDGAVGGTSSR